MQTSEKYKSIRIFKLKSTVCNNVIYKGWVSYNNHARNSVLNGSHSNFRLVLTVKTRTSEEEVSNPFLLIVNVYI